MLHPHDNPQHHLCPDGEDSWCGYKRDSEHTNVKMEFYRVLLNLLIQYLTT